MSLRLQSLALWLVVAAATLAHAEPISVLFLGDNGHHNPRARFDEVDPVLRQRGIEMTYTDDVDDLKSLDKSDYAALVVYANIDAITPDQAAGLLSYVKAGGGFVPLHCASYCFRNNDEITALIGGQFMKHGTGIFRTLTAAPEHPILQGMRDIESWDETYVHAKHNETDRTVLQFRVDAEGREPYTWVKPYGDGRVFYTAWGHDERTWSNAGFIELVNRGIRWAAGRELTPAQSFVTPAKVTKPAMTSLPAGEAPFTYVDVGAEIPNYTPSKSWGTQGKALSTMQEPLPPSEAIKRIVTPEGFHVELFVSEPELGGKPIAMTWDERGRLWVCETYDYPNELQPPGKGRDCIRICEDTDGDGRADKFTVFAESLSIPTSIAFSGGSVIVQNATETLRLTDTDGDDVADERDVFITGWQVGDTHGGVSNFQYGLDNWIWAMQGYNDSEPVADGVPQERFRMGFFRFRPDGSKVEFIRSTNNNTWGLGIGEDGLIFGSTANSNPSVFMPIPNRYYESVRGWTPSLTLSSIADTYKFEPIVPADKVRQVDQHGGYTAGAGHALYTGRHFPKEYWNRVAFVNGPTGHLVGSFVLDREGTGYRSTSPFNLFASDDEWSAPIMAEVGPDGAVWVIDWYNYIVQHNPTPEGFKTGKGNAYETKLRDKKHGRIYRVVYDHAPLSPVPNLHDASTAALVEALDHPTMLVRKHAQRLLVERGDKTIGLAVGSYLEAQPDVAPELNVAAVHALWTLHGLGMIDGTNDQVMPLVYGALKNASPAVRRNAIQVLPPTETSVTELIRSGVLFDIDAQVRLAATLALADLPVTSTGAAELVTVLRSAEGDKLLYLRDAATSAAAHHGDLFLQVAATSPMHSPAGLDATSIVANHYARGADYSAIGGILKNLKTADPLYASRVVAGLLAGFRDDAKVTLSPEDDENLVALIENLPSSSKIDLISLATKLGSARLEKYAAEIETALAESLADESSDAATRIAAAKQIIEFRPGDASAIDTVLETWTARTDAELANGLIDALSQSRSPELGDKILEVMPMMTPGVRSMAIALLLKRPDATRSLVAAAESGEFSIGDMSLDQKQALASHPDEQIASAAKTLLADGGSLPNADRQKVLDELSFVTMASGDAANGKAMFTKHCATCHMHSGVGAKVGPELTGMAVHPKIELLTHILDPSRSVESNFKLYTVLTVDGSVLSGTLASESKTAIDLYDAKGERRAILRDDIDSMVASRKSIMPEGFEKLMTPGELTDLLEFLTSHGTYLPLDFSKVASVSSESAMFSGSGNTGEYLMFDDWEPKTFGGVPFVIRDPQQGKVANIVLLRSPNSDATRRLPTSVELPAAGHVKAVHLLSGVSGWGFPYGGAKTVSMIVRFHYADGNTEDHELKNGIHFADYIRHVDVPESQFAFDLAGRQIRYLAVTPDRDAVMERIEFLKGPDETAPVIMAATLETK